MSDAFTVGLVQMTSSDDLHENIAAAASLIRQAAGEGARFVLTPENTCMIADGRAATLARAMPEGSHPGIPAFGELAQELDLWLLIGSLSIELEAERAANRSFLFTPEGEIAARYDKIHMFDVDVPDGQSYRESGVFRPGEQLVTAELPWGRLGLSICYDLRFPQLYRRLAQEGASFLSVPAAFTAFTGHAHWQVLLRARAIETGCFVFAPAQCGTHVRGRKTYGHSLVVAPWGEILAEAGESPGVVMARIDPGRVGEARRMIPALTHDRPLSGPARQ